MLVVKEPQTSEEFSAYYDLRWRILRQPWNQPKGSEKDDQEEEAYHIMVVKEGRLLAPLGVGRIHLNNKEEAQIRYMAVTKNMERQGIGLLILKKVESHAQKIWKAKKIVLNARENAVGFYEKFGYKKIKKAHTLFGKIPHYQMEKKLK